MLTLQRSSACNGRGEDHSGERRFCRASSMPFGERGVNLRPNDKNEFSFQWPLEEFRLFAGLREVAS